MEAEYTEDAIKTLDWREHIRMRPGMYIGKLGDGTMADDGLYVLLKEVIDNSIDEFVMGVGKKIMVSIRPDGTCKRSAMWRARAFFSRPNNRTAEAMSIASISAML